jgi:hypothetical protein
MWGPSKLKNRAWVAPPVELKVRRLLHLHSDVRYFHISTPHPDHFFMLRHIITVLMHTPTYELSRNDSPGVLVLWPAIEHKGTSLCFWFGRFRVRIWVGLLIILIFSRSFLGPFRELLEYSLKVGQYQIIQNHHLLSSSRTFLSQETNYEIPGIAIGMKWNDIHGLHNLFITTAA